MPRKPIPDRILNRLSTSEEHVDGTRKTYERAISTLAAATTYGNANHVEAARRTFHEAVEIYVDALRTHAQVVTDYAAWVA